MVWPMASETRPGKKPGERKDRMPFMDRRAAVAARIQPGRKDNPRLLGVRIEATDTGYRCSATDGRRMLVLEESGVATPGDEGRAISVNPKDWEKALRGLPGPKHGRLRVSLTADTAKIGPEDADWGYTLPDIPHHWHTNVAAVTPQKEPTVRVYLDAKLLVGLVQAIQDFVEHPDAVVLLEVWDDELPVRFSSKDETRTATGLLAVVSPK